MAADGLEWTNHLSLAEAIRFNGLDLCSIWRSWQNYAIRRNGQLNSSQSTLDAARAKSTVP